MRFNFKKISAIVTSALMTVSGIGFAAAANYPAPFVANGAANVAVVYGASAAQTDFAQAGSIQTNLDTGVTVTSGSTVIDGDSWSVQTTSDNLELGESIYDVEKYIDESNLALLTDGILSNEKGDAKYEQFFYFDDASSSSVVYTEDDDSNLGLFFKISDGAVIARYVMDFTTNLKSDIEPDTELSDIEDKDITFLGKTYTITTANNGTSGVELTLMSGAEKAIAKNDETINVGGKDVSVLVSSTTEAQFTVDGVTLDKMNKGETVKLADGTHLGVSDITYQNFAGGLMQATFHLGADKIEMNTGSTLTVNGETIGEAAVTITSTEAGSDISISEISINMTAEDDLYVPVNGKLSEAANLDEPEVLVSQNWDIVFNGLAEFDSEEISLLPSNSDKQYTLNFNNFNGDAVELPVVYATATGLKGGEYDTADKDLLVLNASGTITDEDYFVLNTANPAIYSDDARSFVVRYRGADKVTDTDPKVTFDIAGVEQSREVSLTSTGTFDLKLGGSTFSFANASSGASNNFDITLTTAQLGYSSVANNAGWLQMRTQNNALITVNNTNASLATSSWIVKVDLDDQDKDGDDISLSTAQNVFSVTLSNATSTLEVSTGSVTSSGTFYTNPDNDDETLTTTLYGADVSVLDTSTAPAKITATIPESIVNPMVYITSSEATSSDASSMGALLVLDSDVASVSDKNLIVVGGSCINTAATALLGGAYCGDAFTAETGIGANQYIIKSYATSELTSELALLVAGYEAAETAMATSYLTTQDVDTSKSWKGTSAETASQIVEETA